MYKVCFSADYFIRVWTFSTLMNFLRNGIFLNVLFHSLHICTVASLFKIMCLAKKFHLIFIYIIFVCLCNSAFFHIICLCSFSFSIAFAQFLWNLLCQILIFLTCWSSSYMAPFAINCNILYVLLKFYNVEKPLVRHFTEWKTTFLLVQYFLGILLWL